MTSSPRRWSSGLRFVDTCNTGRFMRASSRYHRAKKGLAMSSFFSPEILERT